MAQTSGFDPMLQVITCKMFGVANWVTHLNGEDSRLRMRPFQWNLKDLRTRPYWSNWSHKIKDFVFLPYISLWLLLEL